MLKINPIVKGKTYNLKGVQACTPEFSVSTPLMKPILKTDIFEKQEKRVNSPLINFLGNKIQNKYVSGETVANNIKNILNDYVGAISTAKFKSEYNKISEKNVIPTIKAYNKISPEETLIAAICKERASSCAERMNAVNGITDKLVKLGDKTGVQTKHYKECRLLLLGLHSLCYLTLTYSIL